MLVDVYAAKCTGIVASRVTVEVDIANGIGIHLVGLADAAVRESLLRTVTALTASGFHIPGRKIVINLAPADVHKSGSGYDLPIAIGIIAASGQRELPLLGKYLVMGELGLDGSVRPVPGALPYSELAAEDGLEGCVLPRPSAMEATECEGIGVYGVNTLEDALRVLSGEEDCSDLLMSGRCAADAPRDAFGTMDFSEICGQECAKRGLEIAAAGGHNVIMIGPPGSGKSSLARALAGILPPMSREEAIQTSKIYSVAGKVREGTGLVRSRPFRSPHASVSIPAMVGGGTDAIMPGEISLAHNGVLFVDEFCEVPKRLLETLRGPMEDRRVVISRLKNKVEYPASFMLVAASNPCPCGYYGEDDKCTCSVGRRLAYLSKLSGPIMDRIDIQLWLHPVPPGTLVKGGVAESSADVSRRVEAARKLQEERFRGEGIFTNAEMDQRLIRRHCPIDASCQAYLEKTMTALNLSARACSRILKLARTIADLDGSEGILAEHLREAVGYRFLDKINGI